MAAHGRRGPNIQACEDEVWSVILDILVAYTRQPIVLRHCLTEPAVCNIYAHDQWGKQFHRKPDTLIEVCRTLGYARNNILI